MAATYNIKGTLSEQFQIGKDGPQLIKNGNNLEISTPSGAFVVDSMSVSSLDIGGNSVSGVPVGGTTGQVLKKSSGIDGDVSWVDDGIDTRYVASSFAPMVNFADLTIFRHKFVYGVSFPISLNGSQVDAITASTSSAVYTIRKNGSSIGSLTWDASATIPTIVFSTSQSFSAGDVMDIIGP